MRRSRAFLSLLLVGALGCGATARSTSPRAGQVRAEQAASDAEPPTFDVEAFRKEAERVTKRLEELRNLRLVGMDDRPVPAFVVQAMNGTELDLADVIGREAFVVAFFATWCDACEVKLRSLARALRQCGPMLLVPVSVDGPETRDQVGEYLRSLGIRESPVLASGYPLFAFSYNSFNTVPLLVIVGQNGGLVDYQLGYEVEHERRLLGSLRWAQNIAPLAAPKSLPTRAVVGAEDNAEVGASLPGKDM
jgi:hypothetical protein